MDFFRTHRHWADWFPGIAQVHRTTFARQAANLWKVKHDLWQQLLGQIDMDPAISVVDSFPVPLCRFARASRCRLMPDAAAYGYDEVARQTFYGFRAHVRICWPGVIAAIELTPAHIHDLTAVEYLTDDSAGWLLGDRNYWSHEIAARLDEKHVTLLARFKSAKRDTQPWPHWHPHALSY